MSRFLAPLSPKHRHEKHSRNASLDDDRPSIQGALNSPARGVTTGAPPAASSLPPIVTTEQTSMQKDEVGPIFQIYTPPQSPPLPPRHAPTGDGPAPQPSNPSLPTITVPDLSEDKQVDPQGPLTPPPLPPRSPVGGPIFEAIQQPLLAVKDAVSRDDLSSILDPALDEDNLTVEELRKQYEDEEVERFLRVFARQVNEVRQPIDLPPAESKARAAKPDGDLPVIVTEGENGSIKTQDEDMILSPTTTLNTMDEDGEEWRFNDDGTLVSEPAASSYSIVTEKGDIKAQMILPAKSIAAQGLERSKVVSKAMLTFIRTGEWPIQSPAEYIALEVLVPSLPPAHRKTYHFSFSALQASAARLYLATYPHYAPIGTRLGRLATWTKPSRSAVYCALFWVLWWYNMLIPALLTRTLYELLRRRYSSYPSASELRARRLATARADAVADALRLQLDAHVSSGLGVRDVWRVWRTMAKGKKKKAQDYVANGLVPPQSSAETKNKDKDEEIEDEDVRRFVLAFIEEVADFHERFVNISLWRHPDASKRYSIILFVVTLVTVFIPAQYLAKGLYAVLGSLFWFAPTIWLALPLEHRSRLPPPFADVPTDAEYAMEIISERVARGETALPAPLRNKRRNKRGATAVANGIGSPSSLSIMSNSLSSEGARSQDTIMSPMSDDAEEDAEDDSSENWKQKMGIHKLREKAVRGWIWAEEGRRMLKGEDNRSLPGYDEGHAHHLVKTYPVQRGSAMGMLTVTPTMLLFTPALTSHVKLKIPLRDIRSVKKAGAMGGLKVKYVVRVPQTHAPSIAQAILDNRSVGIATGTVGAAEAEQPLNGEPVEKEEKFRWVGGRDECFAQLVGLAPGRWVRM